MKSMKSLAAMLALATIAQEANELIQPDRDPVPIKPKPHHKGHKEFKVEGMRIWALNEKNARRKAKNILKNK